MQRGTIDGDTAPPIPKLLKEDIEPRAKRFPCPHCVSGALSAELPSQEKQTLVPKSDRHATEFDFVFKGLRPYGVR